MRCWAAQNPRGCPRLHTRSQRPTCHLRHCRQLAGIPTPFLGCLLSLAGPRGQGSKSGCGQAPAPGKAVAVRMGPREGAPMLGDLGGDAGSCAPLVSAEIRV